jgi:hypothetical protein
LDLDLLLEGILTRNVTLQKSLAKAKRLIHTTFTIPLNTRAIGRPYPYERECTHF